MARLFFTGKKKSCFNVLPLIWQDGVKSRKCTSEFGQVAQSQASDSEETEPKLDNPFISSWSFCVNEVRLLGNLGANAQQYTNLQLPYVYFPMATNTLYRRKSGEKVNSVTWHKVIVKNPNMQAFALKYLVKGCRVFVSGSLHNGKLGQDTHASELPETHVVTNKIILLHSPRQMDDSEDNTHIMEQ